MVYEFCPNCNEKIVNSGFFGTNRIKTNNIDHINTYLGKNVAAFCETCWDFNYTIAMGNYREEINKYKKIQTELIHIIPCINVQATNIWDYEIIGLVTAQSTMGTGFYSELSSDFNDFFGLESQTMNKKVSLGEQNCLNIMRVKTLGLGGNAVIGIDIDYAEVGSLRGMILVCTTGTAVRIKNLEVFGDKTREAMESLYESSENIKNLNRYIETLES